MPWTDVKTFEQGARIVAAAARSNAGVLIDAIHFDRAGDVPASIAAAPLSRMRYMKICDAPATRPQDLETLLFQARADRLMPGDGGLDLRGILLAVPRDVPLSVEIPMQALTLTVRAVPRTRQMLEKARRLLDTL